MSEKVTNLSEIYCRKLGANASYVEGLLNRYKSDPNLVDESWRTYFSDLLNGNAPSEEVQSPKSKVQSPTTAPKTEIKSTETAAKQPTKSETKVGEGVEVKKLTGVAKVIVENMEES